MKRKLWKEIMVAVLLVSTILSFSPVAYGETTSVQQSIDKVKMEMKKAALTYVEPALKGELVSSTSLDAVLNSVKKNYEATKKLIQASSLSEKEKQAKLKEIDALYEEKIVKGLIPYIDAYNYATKYLDPLLKEIKEAEAKNDFLAVEKAYHKISVQLKSRTSILYRFTGKAPRDLLLEKYKKPADTKRDEMIVPVTIIMKLTNAQKLYQAGKIEEAKKAIEDIPVLVAKLSSTNPFHQALIKELERLQAIFFPAPVAPVVPTPPVTPPSAGGGGGTSGPVTSSVKLAPGSLGIAGNKKITGLTAATKYVVTKGTNFYGVLANGTLSAVQTTKGAAETLAVALTSTEIIGLTNGTTYKVEEVKPPAEKTIAEQFPDKKFAKAIADWLGKTGNDTITKDEINSRLAAQPYPHSNHLNLKDLGIESLDGIDIFNGTNITTLSVTGNLLTSLDISGLTGLGYLNAGKNRFTSINVSGLTKLSYMNVSDNQLESLDLSVSGLTNLTYLHVDNNLLTSINVSGLTSLRQLFATDNNLSELDVSGLANLKTLKANPLTIAGVTGFNPAITTDTDLQ